MPKQNPTSKYGEEAVLERLTKTAPAMADDIDLLIRDVEFAKSGLYPRDKEPSMGAADGFYEKMFETLKQAKRLLKWAGEAAEEACQRKETPSQ